MKLSKLLLLVPLLASFGCSTLRLNPLLDRAPNGDTELPLSGVENIALLKAGEERPWLESWRIADKLEKQSEHHPPAELIIPMQPSNTGLGMDVEKRLLNIARQMKEDDRIFLRLESYGPETGSSALSLGMAERALQQIKARLIELQISRRRILISPFGKPDRIPVEFQSGWVELHLIRPSYSARNE